jgi:HlyD family secretion protein
VRGAAGNSRSYRDHRQLDKTILRAPADGIVSVIVAEIGENVRAGEPVELVPLGTFATWQAERAIGDHDRNSLHLRLDPQGNPIGFEPGMTVWLVSPRTRRPNESR